LRYYQVTRLTAEKSRAMTDKSLTVGSIMTTQVLSVAPDDTMNKVQAIFQEHHIHHIPVVDKDKVVGIISYSDYLKLLHGFTIFNTQKSEEYNDAIMRSLLVREVMVKQVAKLRPEDKIELAADIFRENLFHAMPVVDNDGKLKGIITTFDLLNYAFNDLLLLK